MSSPNAPTPDRGRRLFVAGAVGTVATAGLALAPGLRLIEVAAARPAGEAASPKQRWGLLIDVTRCPADCTACVTACNQENHLTGGTAPTDSQWIRKVTLKNARSGNALTAPVMCQHCAEPPCVDVCPTGASMKRADGIVLVDRHICIGCRYCMMACPYKARSFVHEPLSEQNPNVPRGKGCVEGCTLCVHRVDRGELPACVASCPNGAMTFGDLNDPESEIAQTIKARATTQVRADLRLDPGVRYAGL